MARALRIQYPGAFYHVTCRGNERADIFSGREDQKAFLAKLSVSSNIYNVPILAYVLVTNHFHLLLTTPEGNLSEFMRHFNICYTGFFNRTHKRVGHLYQGRYKAYLIDADNYLLEVSRYIHLNPVRIEALRKKSAKERWDALIKHSASSLPGYLWQRKRESFLDYEFVLGYMGGDDSKGRKEYRKFVRRGMAQETDNPLESGKGSGIVGGEDFVQWVKDKLVGQRKGTREQPELRELRKVFSAQELIHHFIRATGERREDVLRRGKNSRERAMLMELMYRFCQISQPEIGRIEGGIDYSAVSQAKSRLHKSLQQDKRLRQRFERLNQQLGDLSRSKI
jgi:putative transposase